jgi:serine/threonine-protein kinase
MSGELDPAGKYVLRHRLGKGGMGVVHLGTMVTPAGERPVAIKRLRTDEAADASALDQIVAEARLVFQLTHANICQVLDLATSDQGTFIVMEYVDGCDLRTLLKQGPLDVPAAVYVMREVCKGLDYAHRRRDANGHALWLVHGDVTPQNILMSREGEVKLADFGIARALGAGPGNHLQGGTPGFVSPEARAGRADQRADIYSLGASLYTALAGRAPDAHEGIDVDALAAARVECEGELAALLRRATAPMRDARYSSVAELEHALSLHLAHRYPSFTTTSLAKLVQAAVVAREPVADDAQPLTLTSVTQTTPEPRRSKPHPTPVSEAAEAGPRGTLRFVPEPPRRSRWPLRAAVATALSVAVGATSFGLWFRAKERTAPHPDPVRAAPATEAKTPTAKETSSAVHATEARAMDPPPTLETEPVAPPRAVAAQRAPSAHASRDKRAPAVGMGRLSVNAEPWGVVFVDGRRFAELTPVYQAPIAAGSHKVTVYNPERKRHSPAQTVIVGAGQTREIGFRW